MRNRFHRLYTALESDPYRELYYVVGFAGFLLGGFLMMAVSGG